MRCGTSRGGIEMPLYTIKLHRHVMAYRTMAIEGASPGAARRKALAIIRGENGYDGASPGDGDDVGEWCDDTFGRAVVDGIETSDLVEAP